MTTPTPKPVTIHAEAKDLKGRYANHISITSQERDVVIDFSAIVKVGESVNASLVSRVFLNRFTAQELAELLQKTIAVWEQRRYGDGQKSAPGATTE